MTEDERPPGRGNGAPPIPPPPQAGEQDMTDTDYTPTTDEVREMWIDGSYEFNSQCPDRDVSGPEFDRWLAAHYAELAAERDALRAQLENMTTERNAWGNRAAHAETEVESLRYEMGDLVYERRDTVGPYRGHRFERRLVGPWMVVTD